MKRVQAIGDLEGFGDVYVEHSTPIEKRRIEKEKPALAWQPPRTQNAIQQAFKGGGAQKDPSLKTREPARPKTITPSRDVVTPSAPTRPEEPSSPHEDTSSHAALWLFGALGLGALGALGWVAYRHHAKQEGRRRA